MNKTANNLPAIGATVAIVQDHNAPQIGAFLGLDRQGRAHVRRAIGGAWAGDPSKILE